MDGRIECAVLGGRDENIGVSCLRFLLLQNSIHLLCFSIEAQPKIIEMRWIMGTPRQDPVESAVDGEELQGFTETKHLRREDS